MPDHDDRAQLANRQAPEPAGTQLWFHGSPHRIADGTLIEPGHEPVNMEGEHDGYVYFTGSPEAAAEWAGEGSRYLNEEGYRGYRSNPHVYEVEPTGEYERDPTAEFPGESGDHRSARPLRVIRERHDLGLMHDLGCPGCNLAGRHATTINRTQLDDRGGALEHGTIPRASGNVKEPNGARADAGGLRIARGLWYRLHRSDQLDLDSGRARSRPLDYGGPGQAGLSAFARPHHLLHYATELTWGSRRETPYLPEDRGVLRRVVAFHGREIGRGDDDEPLVRPEPDSSCCGRIVHEHMAWSTFVRKLSDTPKPSTRWTLDQAQEKGRRRVSAGRGRQAASRRRATGMAGAVEQSRPRRVS